MRATTRTLLLLLAGSALLHTTVLTDLYLRYVKPGLQPLLVASAVLLLAAGTLSAVRDGFPFLSRGAGRPGPADGRAPAVALLLFVPVLLLLFAPPAPLGVYSATRAAPQEVPDQSPSAFLPLPEADPLPLSLTQFTARVTRDSTGAVAGRNVRLHGFTVPGDDGADYLARHVVTCCAADARTLRVVLHGARGLVPGRWVEVEGRWRPEGVPGTSSAGVGLDVSRVRTVPAPAQPYLDVPPAGR